MAIFKVWNADRTKKRFVKASSLQELMEKGCEKLELGDSHGCSVALEKDGTIIDEDEILMEMTAEVLMILLSSETWVSALATASSNASMASGELASCSSGESVMGMLTLTTTLADAIVEQHEIETASLDQSHHKSPKEDILQIAAAIRAAPLPTFDELSTRMLEQGKPEVIWNKLVSQIALYYFGKWPTIGDSSHYREIGRKMLEKYPSIKQQGVHEWSVLVKNVSQKIRHIRHNLKAKSQLMEDGSPPPKASFKPASLSISVSADRPNDVQAHIAELQKEWRSKQLSTHNMSHIKLLLNHTREYRVNYLNQHPNGRIRPLIDEFPCFEDARYLLYEFGLIMGNERTRTITTAFKRCMLAAEMLMESRMEGAGRMLPVVHYMEQSTTFKRGSGKEKGKRFSASSVLVVLKNIADSDVARSLETAEGEPLHLVVLTVSTNITGVFIVGDTVVIRVPNTDILSATLLLLVSYYVFDLEYPRIYANFLGVLQTLAVGEPYIKGCSKQCTFFIKKLRAAMERVTESLPDEEP